MCSYRIFRTYVFISTTRRGKTPVFLQPTKFNTSEAYGGGWGSPYLDLLPLWAETPANAAFYTDHSYLDFGRGSAWISIAPYQVRHFRGLIGYLKLTCSYMLPGRYGSSSEKIIFGPCIFIITHWQGARNILMPYPRTVYIRGFSRK